MNVAHVVGRVILNLNSVPGFVSATGDGIECRRPRAELGTLSKGLAIQQAFLGSCFVLDTMPGAEDKHTSVKPETHARGILSHVLFLTQTEILTSVPRCHVTCSSVL